MIIAAFNQNTYIMHSVHKLFYVYKKNICKSCEDLTITNNSHCEPAVIFSPLKVGDLINPEIWLLQTNLSHTKWEEKKNNFKIYFI